MKVLQHTRNERNLFFKPDRVERFSVYPLLRSRGRGFVINTHLCKEYAQSATTNTDNK